MMERKQMNSGKSYALLISVSRYDEVELADLPVGTADLWAMKNALTGGMHFPDEQIRIMGEDGTVPLRGFVRALQEFASLLSSEDLFLLYFSGHGSHGQLHFSDESISLQSVADYLSDMPAKSKILILDCCFSGAATAPAARQMYFEDTIDDFAGRGIAVMASSSPDERSWIDPESGVSVYTQAVCAAMRSKWRVHKGQKSLFDLNEEVRSYMSFRNRMDPSFVQHPFFKASLGGTVYFPVAEYTPYARAEIELSGNAYELYDVKSISMIDTRRLVAFLLTDGKLSPDRISTITKEVAEELKDSPVAGSAREELRFQGIPARAIWCYFGQDPRDMKEHSYYAYSIWAADEEVRAKFFREGSHMSIVDGICIWENSSYELIRKMRSADPDRDEYIRKLQTLLSVIVSCAEEFIAGLHAWKNGETTLSHLRNTYRNWYLDVHRTYIQLTDLPVPPEDLSEWCDAVFDLAGWVLDLALPLDEKAGYDDAGISWLLTHAVEKYYESMEKIRVTEQQQFAGKGK